MSETAKHREIFLPYCIARNGLDIGYGGDPIVDSAITVDLPDRYSFVGDKPQNIACDAQNLYMFSNNSLDYIYSSHCLEDFTDTKTILREWLRIIKVNGYLLLLLPDEQVYRFKSKTHNANHKHLFFNLDFVLNILSDLSVTIIESGQLFENDDYNFYIIAKKKG